MTRTVSDPWAGEDDYFNRPAATAVLRSMMAMDEPTALVYGRALVAGAVHHDLVAHHAALAKRAGAQAAARAAALRDLYTRQAVAKARAGQDNGYEVRALVAIEKAFDFTAAERSNYARAQRRDAGGRFVAEHHHVHTDEAAAPMNPLLARDAGIAKPAAALSDADLAHYQQAYRQVRDLIAPYRSSDLRPLVHLHIRGAGGEHTRVEEVPTDRRKDLDLSAALQPGERIESASVSVRPKANAAGASFDTLASLGAPRAGAAATHAFDGVLSPQQLKRYNDEVGKPIDANEAYSPSRRAFRRLEHGSTLLSESLGPAAPAQLQYALKVANHVGQFGPEAQKVIGPIADRTAYRYRGTERTPSRALRDAFAALAATPSLDTPAKRRDAAVGGVTRTFTDHVRAVPSRRTTGGTIVAIPNGKTSTLWNPGPVLDYFHDRLPDPDLNELQRRSGVVPPSMGIIINRAGKVVTQATGYADDWYLPFNLRHLAALHGGEYIRTRTFGGPTTEDIYTGLLSGARSVTVVSHSGVYTVEFDHDLRGGRRFNDKAARMVGRYGHLLDALRSRQVRHGELSPSRKVELRDLAATTEPDIGSEGFRRRYQQLEREEYAAPKLSRQETQQVARQWLSEQAAGLATKGSPKDANDLIAMVENRAGRQLDTEEAAKDWATTMGRGPEFAQYLDAARQDNAARLRPFDLDGAGYLAALQALKEQFPYYIDNVTYHPWTQAAGLRDAGRPGTRDTGYVRPRHNRPAAAEAGYFDDKITGHGKVRADTTRFQNRRVTGGMPVPAGGTDRPFIRDTSGDLPAPPARQAPAQATPGQQRNAADHAMLDELLGKQDFEPHAATHGVQLGGVSIRDAVDDEGFPLPATREFYAADPAELGAQLDDPARAQHVRDLMQAVAGEAAAKRLFTVKPSVLDAFRREGRPVKVTPLPDDVAARLAEMGQEHEFEQSAYDPHSVHDAAVIHATYTQDKHIGALRVDGAPLQLEASDFDEKARRLNEQLSTEHRELARNAARGDVDTAAQHRLERESAALDRAAQLHRRWNEAQERARRAAPAPEPEPRDERHLHIYNGEGELTPEALREMLDRVEPGHAEHRTIEGSTG